MIGNFYYGMEQFANSLSDSFEELVFRGTLVYMIKGKNIDCFVKVKKEEASSAKELLPFFKRLLLLFENLYLNDPIKLKNLSFNDFQLEIKKMIMRDLSYLFAKEERNSNNGNNNSEKDQDVYLSSKIIFSLLNNFERVNEYKNGSTKSVKSKYTNKLPNISNIKEEKNEIKEKNPLNNNYFDHILQYS